MFGSRYPILEFLRTALVVVVGCRRILDVRTLELLRAVHPFQAVQAQRLAVYTLHILEQIPAVRGLQVERPVVCMLHILGQLQVVQGQRKEELAL